MRGEAMVCLVDVDDGVADVLGGAEVLLADVVDLQRLVQIAQHTGHVAEGQGVGSWRKTRKMQRKRTTSDSKKRSIETDFQEGAAQGKTREKRMHGWEKWLRTCEC